uniref:Ankyrin repeat and SOCS box containing 18 n=1 Tax=Zosterops lateralis melanops TaxID=1220523 RepID=A0A8D2QQB5_ZOSLA
PVSFWALDALDSNSQLQSEPPSATVPFGMPKSAREKQEKQSLELAGRQGWGCRAHPMPCPAGLWTLEERWELSTPLCLAARHGHPDCLRHLLRRGADPNLAPGGQAPLHWACQGGHSHCLELLLEYRADPNLRSDEGMAPLHLCTSPVGGVPAHGRMSLALRSHSTQTILGFRDNLTVHPLCTEPRSFACGKWALLGAAAHRDRRPHVTVQLLLNHGSQRIWPPAFGKVPAPERRPRIPSLGWLRHREGLFPTERGFIFPTEQWFHLCRSAIRARLGGRCHSLIPLLPLPGALREFLLLEPQGLVL